MTCNQTSCPDHYSRIQAWRLFFTIILGGLGAWLCRGPWYYFPIPLIGADWTAVAGWLAAALAGAGMLRRLARKNSAGWAPAVDRPAPGRRAGIIRRVIRALAAPYFLYAARPRKPAGQSPFAFQILRLVWAGFPYIFAMGAANFVWHYSRPAGSAWFDFGMWAWISCALLHLFCPPSERIPWPDFHALYAAGKAGIRLALALIVLAGIVLLLACVGRGGWLLAWAVPLIAALMLGFCAFTWLACPLLLLLKPASAEHHQAGCTAAPLQTAAAMAVAAISLATYGGYALFGLLTGRMFHGYFGHDNAGFCMDQPSIGKWLLLFTIFAALMLVFMAIARAVMDGRRRAGYWAFALSAILIGLFLFSILTADFYMLLLYIREYGFTLRRIAGLVFCAGSFLILAAFYGWALRPFRPPAKTAGNVAGARTAPAHFQD